MVNGRAYHDSAYTFWQHGAREALVREYGVPVPYDRPFGVRITLWLLGRGRCDLDNLAAGVMDAFQPPGAKGHQGDVRLYPGVLWTDDRWLREMACEMRPSFDGAREWIQVEVYPVQEIEWPKRRKKRTA